MNETYTLKLNTREVELIIHSLDCDTQGTWGDGREENIQRVIKKIRSQQKASA